MTRVIASKEGTNDTFPVVTRTTLGVVYKDMMAALVLEVKKLTYGVTKDPDAQFSTWSKPEDDHQPEDVVQQVPLARQVESRHILYYFIRHVVSGL